MSFAVWHTFKSDPPCTNACRYATEEEATEAGHELMSRWFVPIGFEVRPSEDPVNYKIQKGGRPEPIRGDA